MLALKRVEEEVVKRAKGWLLVYGRRKVGKTFLLKRVAKWDLYVTITRTREALVEGGGGGYLILGLEEAVREAVKVLEGGGSVVMDEFQRLGERFWEVLALSHPRGRFVACGSSLGIASRILDRRSPLLGLLAPLRIDIVRYCDAVASLLDANLKPRDALLWGVVLRDPWVVPYLEPREETVKEVAKASYQLMLSASGLVGEVFEEEDRALTDLYDAVLRLVGAGIWRSLEIANTLVARGLAEGGLPTVVGILDRLVKMGLLEKVPLWRTRGARYYYKHRSPILSMLYRLNHRYSISEAPEPKMDVTDGVKEVLAIELQFNLGEMLARKVGGRRAYTILPRGEGDVDIVILDPKGRQAVAAYEVKMGGFTLSEARRAVNRLKPLGVLRVGLISLEEKPPKAGAPSETFGPEDLARIAKALASSSTG